MVRVRFRLIESTQTCWGNGRRLVFQPICDSNIPETQRFADATPSGRLEMQVNNPAALEKLELGYDYYLDFSPADPQ